MSFVLDLHAPVADAVRAIALERLDRVVGELAGERSEDPATAVHEARKDLKRLRSLVRLLRPGLDRKVHRREADALRDVSRGLGARRDADALLETVDALRDPAAGRVPAATLERLRGAIASSSGTPDDGDDLQTAIVALRAVRGRVADGALAVDGRSTLKAGLSRSYDRASLAFAHADAAPDAELVHDWRKRVKDLWYQQALLADAWPPVLKAYADEAKALSQVLGDDHDLDALDRLLRDPAGPAAAVPSDTDALLEVVAARRAELLLRARTLGVRVHAEKPKAFRRRIGRWLDAPPL